MNNHKWIHVHEIRTKWLGRHTIERCLGEIPYTDAVCYYFDAVDDESGTLTYWWIDEPEDTCRFRTTAL